MITDITSLEIHFCWMQGWVDMLMRKWDSFWFISKTLMFRFTLYLLQSGIDSVMQVSATLVIGALDHWSIRWLQADTGHPSSGKSLWQGAWTRTRGFRLENTTLAKTRQSFHKTHPARCDSTKLQIHLCFGFIPTPCVLSERSIQRGRGRTLA